MGKHVLPGGDIEFKRSPAEINAYFKWKGSPVGKLFDWLDNLKEQQAVGCYYGKWSAWPSMVINAKEHRMKKLMGMFLVSMMLVLGYSGISHALDFKVGPFFTQFRDVTAYHRNFGKDEVPRMATGIAGSTLAKMNHNGVEIASFFTPFVMGGTTVTGEARPTAIFGAELINLMGLRFGVDYNTDDSKWGMMFGISLTGLAEQFANTPTK